MSLGFPGSLLLLCWSAVLIDVLHVHQESLSLGYLLIRRVHRCIKQERLIGIEPVIMLFQRTHNTFERLTLCRVMLLSTTQIMQRARIQTGLFCYLLPGEAKAHAYFIECLSE